jgi:hypothetical protein
LIKSDNKLNIKTLRANKKRGVPVYSHSFLKTDAKILDSGGGKSNDTGREKLSVEISLAELVKGVITRVSPKSNK